MSGKVKVTSSEIEPNGHRLVKGSITYPMGVITNFIAFLDVDGPWMITDDKENAIPGAAEADIIRGIEYYDVMTKETTPL